MSAKRKIVYIISAVNKSLAFEWIATQLRESEQLEFILLNPGPSVLEDFLNAAAVPVRRIRYRGKKDFIFAWCNVWSYLFFRRPHAVHAHLFDAQLIGLTAAWLAGIRKRIYTRHNSTYHQLYFPASVKYDRLSNRLATHIISISQATDHVLLQLEHADARKLRKIPHGFDLSLFGKVDASRVEKLRSRWQVPLGHPCMGVIARHVEWKGIQYILPAFKNLREQFPNAVLLMANCGGPYHETLQKLIDELPTGSVVQIPFEEDIPALYALMDVYVHVPVDATCEAFGQTYVESLASGVPSVFTLSGIAVEFVEHGKNALVVPYRDEKEIAKAVQHIIVDESLREQLRRNGRESVKRFALPQMLEALQHVYDE